MHIQTSSPAIFKIHCFPFPPIFNTNRIILIQYVSGNTSEIIFAQKGKQFRGILEPENNVIGVSKSGKNKIVEVVSPRQSTKYIVNKVNDMVSANRNSVGKVITWVRLMFK